MAANVSQEPVEVIVTPIPAARQSQEPVEVLITPKSGAVVSQAPLEVLSANTPAPPTFSYWKVGVLDVPAGGGTQAITGLGSETPQGLVFLGANWITENLVVPAAGCAIFRGMAAPKWDSPGTISQHAAAVGPGDQHRVTSSAIVNLTTGGTGTVLYQANVTSFDPGGFTLSWSTGAAGYKVIYAALFRVDHCSGYVGTVDASLASVGFKAGAALVHGAWAGPTISGDDRSQEWYGGGAYPSTASGNWFGSGMSVQCFPTSQSGQNQVYLDSMDPTILTVSGQHFTGPFLTGSNIKAYPSGAVGGEGFEFGGDSTNGGMAMFWSDDDSKCGYATPSSSVDGVTAVGLPFDPGMVLGYSVSDEPRAQGTGSRSAAGLSITGLDNDGDPFVWGALIDRINPGAIQSFTKIPNVVHDSSVQTFEVELVVGGFEMTTVDVGASPVSWLWHAFGHPFTPSSPAWMPQIYRRIVTA